MRWFWFALLVVVTAGAVAAATWAVIERERATQVADVPDQLYPGLIDRVNDVARVEIVTPALSFSIVKGEGEGWGVPERGGYPVKFETVKQAVVGIASLEPLEAKTSRPELHEKLHLRRPDEGGKGTMLVLKDAGGTEIAGVVVGKTKSTPTSTRAGWHYVRKATANQSWLAAGRVEVWDKISRWLDSDMPIVDRARIHRVRTEKPDGEVIEISRDDPEGRDFKVDNLEEGWRMIHDTSANALGSALGFLTFEDVEPAADAALEAPVVAEYTTFDGLVLTIRLEKHKSAYRGRFEARFDADRVALDGLSEAQREKMKSAEEVQTEAKQINVRYGPWVYKFPEYKGKDFTISREEIVMKKEKADSGTSG